MVCIENQIWTSSKIHFAILGLGQFLCFVLLLPETKPPLSQGEEKEHVPNSSLRVIFLKDRMASVSQAFLENCSLCKLYFNHDFHFQ